MKIGLFFGSFNPIHIGHLIIANHMASQTDLQKVWLVVSPQNPLKPKKTLARDHDRLHLVRLGIGDNPLLEASNIEFGLPKPSYTVDTLAVLKEKYPQHEFALIMGGDNLISLPKWKNYELLMEKFKIYIYKRPNYNDQTELAKHPNIVFTDAPLLDISSTQIREMIKQGKSIRYMVPEEVIEAIEDSRLYKS